VEGEEREVLGGDYRLSPVWKARNARFSAAITG
jgi:hypothetical protein